MNRTDRLMGILLEFQARGHVRAEDVPGGSRDLQERGLDLLADLGVLRLQVEERDRRAGR